LKAGVKKVKRKRGLEEKYPPSQPCSCDICVAYCMRPGWWTVSEAARAIDAGYAPRMMLEMASDLSYGVLSPAFKGCEGAFALQAYWGHGCTFLKNSLCELFGSGFSPLECRFCHHERKGLGQKCHSDIDMDWRLKGEQLVKRWVGLVGLWEPYAFLTAYARIHEPVSAR
jgi:hypothetical protein